jgi:S1-C subfamily serine protease
MFHTGLHDDYHRPSDDSHKVNPQGMEQAARFLFAVAYQLADKEAIGEFRREGEHETPGHMRQLEAALPAAPPRLGIRWYAQSEGEGLVLAQVERGRAGDRGGLLAGDRLLEFGGQTIHDKVAFRQQVMRAVSPVEFTLQRAGEEEPLKLTIELDGIPSRVGVAWRVDQGEPGTVILTRVVHESPAALAGLKPGDRIYEVNGESFQGSTELFEALTTRPGPLEVTVEREGRLRTLTLDLPPLATS